MKAITFLGLGKYEETTYEYSQKQVTTRFFTLALPQFFPELQQVLVFVTPKVRESEHLSILQRELGNLMCIVDIPNGNTEAELWEIFDALIENVQPGDDLIFDITHSFRSLPFLTFLVAAYLRIARHVKVQHVLYGAYQAKGENSQIAPVFDLSPFVELLDWITATQQMLDTGNAQRIAKFLIAAGKENQQSIFKDTGKSLDDLTAQLLLCHPLEVMEDAEKLANRINRVEKVSLPEVKPFYLLLDTLKDEYTSRALADPLNNVAAALRIQYNLILWYAEKGLWMQAITLAREWVVSVVGWKMMKTFVLHLDQRKELERGLTGLARLLRQESDTTVDNLNESGKFLYKSYGQPMELARAYDMLTQLRNDVNHAGMSQNSQAAQKITQKFKEEILPTLKDLRQWNESE